MLWRAAVYWIRYDYGREGGVLRGRLRDSKGSGGVQGDG